MNSHTYSIDNCLPLGTAPSYTWVPAGTPDTIGMDFDQGPNVPGDINWGTRSRWVLMDGVRQVQASGTVDDRVTMLLPGMLYTSSSGAPHPFSEEPYTPAAGFYPCCITHYNIPDYPICRNWRAKDNMDNAIA